MQSSVKTKSIKKKFKKKKITKTEKLLFLLRKYNDLTNNNILLVELRSISKVRRLSEARHIIGKYLYENEYVTLEQVGSLLNRDHASVWYGRKLVDTIPYLKKRYRLFVELINNQKHI